MADIFSKKKRSAIMASVRGKHTAPEGVIKKLLRASGFRYRSHVSSLPGTPDIILPAERIAIFVNGCFWHGHKGCRRSKLPTTNVAFWKRKISKNVTRDRAAARKLRKLGWNVRIYWTCAKTSQFESVLRRLAAAR